MYENEARGNLNSDVYQECVQELRRPYLDCVEGQGLATLSLVEVAQEVARKLLQSFLC